MGNETFEPDSVQRPSSRRTKAEKQKTKPEKVPEPAQTPEPVQGPKPVDLPEITSPDRKLVLQPFQLQYQELMRQVGPVPSFIQDQLPTPEAPPPPSPDPIPRPGNEQVSARTDLPSSISYKEQEKYVKLRDKDKRTGKKEIKIQLSPPVTLETGDISPHYREIGQKDGRYVLETLDRTNKVMLVFDGVNIAYDGHEVRLNGPQGETIDLFPHPDPSKAQAGINYSPRNWVGSIKFLTYEVRDGKNRAVPGVRIWEQVRQLDQSPGLAIKPVFRKQIITGEDGKATDVQAFGIDRDHVGSGDATVEQIKNGYVIIEQQLFMNDENIPFAVLKIIQTGKVIRIVGIWQYDKNMASAKN